MFRTFTLIVLCCFGSIFAGFSQVVTSTGTGTWNTASMWSCNCIPTSANSSQIRILNGHNITLNHAAITVNLLSVESGATLTIGSTSSTVFGAVTSTSGASGIVFQNNATYAHNLNGKAIPTATWQSGSTCKVTGWGALTSGTDFTSFTGSLGQSFHNFWWESTAQTAANVVLGGALTTVNGNLTINSTAATTTVRRVVLGYNGSSGTSTTTVGGNLVVSGNSQLALSLANGSGTYTVKVGGNVSVGSTSAIAASAGGALVVNSTSGTALLDITGDLSLTNGVLNFASTSGGTATGSINIGGNLSLTGGTISKYGSTGTGNLTFTGAASHSYVLGSTTFTNSQSINYMVNAGNTLDLGTYALGPSLGAGSFTNYGTIKVASTNNAGGEGAIGGNVKPATRTFYPGSAVIYTGTSTQFMGTDQPGDLNVTTTIANSNGVTLVSDVTMDGDIILQAGNVNLDAFKFTLNGNLTANTNFLGITTESSLELGGSGDFGIIPFNGSGTMLNLTLNRASSTAILNGDLTILGIYDQLDGVLELNGKTFTLQGDFYDNGNFSSNSATSSLIITNPAVMPDEVVFSGPLNTLTMDREDGQLTTSSTFAVTNLNLLNGLVSNSTGLQMAAGGTITRNIGGLSALPGGTGSYNLIYTNDIDHPIDAGNEFHTGATRVNNVTINGGGDVTLTANRTINGALTMTSGGLNASTFILTLFGDFVGNSTGNFLSSNLNFSGNTTISGTSIPALGAITLQGTATLNLPAELSVAGTMNLIAGSTFNHNNGNVTLTGGTASQSINANNAVFHNLTVDKSVNTNVQLASALRLDGLLSIVSTNSKLVSGGFLHLLSTSDGSVGNASIGPLLNGTGVTGNIIAERYMSAEGRIYRYLSSPVTNATVAMWQDDFPITGAFTGTSSCTGCSKTASMFYYDAAQGKYISYPTTNTSAVLAPGRGYSAFVRQDVLSGPVTIDVTGPINQGDVTLPMAYNATAEGWNLVGNPYPSSVNWDNAGGWDKTNISGIAVRDNADSGGIFHYWNGTTGDLQGEIAAGQGFWVQASGPSPSLVIHEQAKMANTGIFYRQGPVDVLTVKLSKGTMIDKTYFQLHDQATMGFDALDISKMANAYFDISTHFPSSTSLMAINAVNSMACGSELDLELRFTKDSNGKFVMTPTGDYVMSFVIEGTKFSNYIVTLVDQFTGAQQVVADNGSISFSVSSDAASYASDRFKLVFGAPAPNLSLQTLGSTAVCDGGEASLVVEGSQTGFEYYLLGSDNKVISEVRSGNGGDITLSIPASSLAKGTNVIRVGVNGFCGENLLTTTWELQRDDVSAPAVTSDKHCLAGEVELSATGASTGGDYRWYETADAATAVGTGAKFTTPEIPKSKTYYASIVTAAGCEGPRQAVVAEVVLYDDAVITAGTGDVLTSNFTSGNQWYFNNELISGATGQTLKAEKSGTYELEVAIGGCSTTGALEYLITGTEAEVTASVSGYPNPAWKEINVTLKGAVQDISAVDIASVTGQAVGKVTLLGTSKEKTGTMNVEQLIQGIYFVKIQLPAKTLVFKFVKQ